MSESQKVVFITGATGELGQALVKTFAASRWQVISGQGFQLDSRIAPWA